MIFQCVWLRTRLGVKTNTDRDTATWVWHRTDEHGRRFPQTIAHRGYKAEHPENTMKAFEGAIEAGSHAIETDIHLSKDNVVVLSHVWPIRSPLHPNTG